jgi:hypothetical protein
LNLGGSNPSDASVTVYAPGTNGNRKPIAMITGPHTQLGPGLQGIAVDADGTIFVTNWDFNSVTVHAPGANGNVPPIAVIQGGNTGLSQPVGIAVGFGHRLYVTNFGLPRPYTVTVYPAGANGDVAPLATLTGSATGLAQPVAIALACVFAGIVPLSPGC